MRKNKATNAERAAFVKAEIEKREEKETVDAAVDRVARQLFLSKQTIYRIYTGAEKTNKRY